MFWLVNPTTARILNGVMGLLPQLPALEPEALKAAARRRAGLSDFGPDDFEEGLAVACRSLAEDARLTFIGRVIVRTRLVSGLVTRLRWVQLRDRQPALFERPLVPPLIILGLPRSGTTVLHRLLAAAPGARPLRAWELVAPLAGVTSPGRSWERRLRRQATVGLEIIRRLAPGLDAKHHFDADAAEEEVSLFDPAMWTPSWWRFAAVRGYLDWYLSADPGPGYRIYRDMLLALQAQTPDQRLTLKLPNHTGYVGALLDAVPEAMVVQTHRDPAPVVASYASLMTSIHGVGSDQVDLRQAGADALRLWAAHAEGNLAARERLAAGRILDVPFSALRADLAGAAEDAMAKLGLPCGGDTVARFAELAAQQRLGVHGQHSYTAAQFGLDEEAIRARFAGYRAIIPG